MNLFTNKLTLSVKPKLEKEKHKLPSVKASETNNRTRSGFNADHNQNSAPSAARFGLAGARSMSTMYILRA